MAFKKAAKTALSDLDKATAEYNKLLALTESTYDKLYAIQDSSLSLLSNVEQLIESISHNPLFIPTAKLKKIKTQKEAFLTRDAVEREKRKDELTAGAGAIAILGASAAAALSFSDLLFEYASKKMGGKFNKNTIVSIIILVVLLIPAITYACGQTRAQKHAAKKAAQNTTKVRKAIAVLKKKQVAAEALHIKLVTSYQILAQYYSNLACCFGARQKDISKEQRSDLIAMLNHALSLATIMNEKID